MVLDRAGKRAPILFLPYLRERLSAFPGTYRRAAVARDKRAGLRRIRGSLARRVWSQ